MNDTGVDPIVAREPEVRSTPTGSPQMFPTKDQMGGELADIFLFPFSIGNVLRRITNPGEQSAASGSVVTNNADSFLTGFKREIGTTVDDVTDVTKTVARSAGSIVGALLPWWLWLLLGLGLLAYVVTIILPYVKKPA